MSMNTIHRYFLNSLTAALCLATTACHLATPFSKPDMDLPEGVRQQSDQSIYAQEKWWSIFHSPELNRMENNAALYNRDLGKAAALVDQAAAMAGMERAAELPQLAASAGARKEELTKGQQYSQSLPNRDKDVWQASGILSYEVDLWGKLRLMTDASRTDLMASLAAQEAVRLRLSAEVASAYIAVATWKRKCGIIRRVHESYEQTCSMYEKRFEMGQYPELALRRVQAERAKTLAQLHQAENELSKSQGILAVLTGESPRAIMQIDEKAARAELSSMHLPSIPEGIPADVANRRPDLKELEMRLRSAHGREQAARLDRYPSLVLTGKAGQASGALDEILHQPNRFYEFGTSALQTVFDGGRKRAAIDVKSAEYRAVECAYEQAFINAFREIRDALTERRLSGEIHAAAKDEVERLRRSWEIASKQYDAGYIGLMDALDIHRSLLNGELQMADAEEMQYNAVVKVCKAMGGGWKKREPIVSAPSKC